MISVPRSAASIPGLPLGGEGRWQVRWRSEPADGRARTRASEGTLSDQVPAPARLQSGCVPYVTPGGVTIH